MTARKLMQRKLQDIEFSARGILRRFSRSAKPRRRSAGRVKELVAGHPHLEAIAESLLAARLAVQREFNRLEKQVRAMARTDQSYDAGGALRSQKIERSPRNYLET